MIRPPKASLVMNSRTRQIGVMEKWNQTGSHCQIRIEGRRYTRWLKSETQMLSEPALSPVIPLSKL